MGRITSAARRARRCGPWAAAACAALAILFAAGCAHGTGVGKPGRVDRGGKFALSLDEAMSGLGTRADYAVQRSPDGRHYTRLEDDGRRIVEYDFATGDPTGRALLDLREVAPHSPPIERYLLSPDGERVLLASNVRPIYRHSFLADYRLYHIPSRTLAPLTERPAPQWPTFSPDGARVAFVSGNNLYVKDLATGHETAVTDDGAADEIYNGLPDWVYEEEFGMRQAYDWAPDGSAIAWLRFDARHEPRYPMIRYEGLYPQVEWVRYPKAGERNAVVTAYALRLADGHRVRLETGEEVDQYLPLLKWTRDPATVALLRLDRRQRVLDYLLCDAATGRSRVVLTDREDQYVEDGTVLDFLPDGRGFITSSERDGWRHLYLHRMDGSLERQLTAGPWDVIAYLGCDARTGRVFYQSAEVSPVQRHLWRVGLDGTGKVNLTPGRGVHAAVEFSGDYRRFILTRSDAVTPPVVELRDADGRTVRTLVDHREALERLALFAITPKELIRVPVSAGVELNGYILRPPGFDPARRYPLVMTVYGGPNSQQVLDAWTFDWTRYLVDRGYVVACVDNRGTGARGEAFRKLTYGQLFRYETEDQIDAARRLASLPGIDGQRIAIYGWSYGGSMALSCLLRGADVFAAAIAVAPVTSYRYYDTIYTERFMDLPQNNPSGYDDWAPLTHASKLRGRLLLVHGLFDDNVHPQNSMELIKALIREGKPFEMYLAPNKNHGIGGEDQRRHLFAAFVDFLDRNLKGAGR